MSRPLHIPVCRIASLPQFARSAYTTPWRRSSRGDYGPRSLDAKGRQQVEIARIEAAHRIVISDAELAQVISARTPRKIEIARKREKLRRLDPGPIRIDTGPVNFFSKGEAEAFALGCVQARDRQWTALLARGIRI